MRKSLRLVGVAACLLIAAAAPVAWSDQSDIGQAGESTLTKAFGPFKFTAGPTDNGSFGATLDGEGRKTVCSACFSSASSPPPENVNRFWYPAFWYLGYATTGTWSNDSNSPNNASISLKPGVDGALFHGIFSAVDPNAPAPKCDQNGHCDQPLAKLPALLVGMGAYADVEYRVGTFPSGSTTARVRQSLGGGGVYFVIPPPSQWGWVIVWPRISATYYAPFSTNQVGDESALLPPDVKLNYVQTEFHTTLGLGPKGWKTQDAEMFPFKLDVMYSGSKATSGSTTAWQNLWKIQLSTGLIGSKRVTPVLSYQSGIDRGFTYDRQWLLGALVEFFDPASNK